METARPIEFAFRDEDFVRIATRVRKETGIALGRHKRDLVYNRLAKRLRKLGLNSFAEYCELLEGPGGSDELGAMVNAITTNLTSFFREKHHFEHLEATVLKPLLAGRAGRARVRLWSAGCSSGEEPYSMAMVLRAALAGATHDARILATDIDTDMIARGVAGRYSAEAAAAIPARYAQTNVVVARSEAIMQDGIKRLIAFKPLNLLHEWPMRGPFDAIFCRNVAIYFDTEGKRAIFDRFAELLRPEGWLYIGHSENLNGISERFTLLGQTTYRKVA